jgi:hypothetical protein
MSAHSSPGLHVANVTSPHPGRCFRWVYRGSGFGDPWDAP